MPCYQCGHCGKCDMYSRVLELKCSSCSAPIGPGIAKCPECGADVLHSMKAGAFLKTTNKPRSESEA